MNLKSGFPVTKVGVPADFRVTDFQIHWRILVSALLSLTVLTSLLLQTP
jgi:hypothetical protein